MRRPHPLRAAAAALAAAALAAACADDPDLQLTPPPAAAPFMARYVALGNSITAGFQSDGINDSTQARSYAALLARAAGTTFRVPAIRRPGCPAPVVNFVTQQRVAPAAGQAAAASGCYGRADTSYTNVLNNVAVPGANSFDPIGQQGGGSNQLTTLILGGRTQAERALDADPTFVTLWIGNNDVLVSALGGVTAGVTDSLAFIANYNATLGQLRSRNGALRGVLIGVADVTTTPLLLQLSAFNPAQTVEPAGSPFAYNAAAVPVLRAFFATAPDGQPRPAAFQLGFNPNCNASRAAISVPVLRAVNAQLPANAPGFVFNCAPGASQPAQLLDDAERAILVNRVAGWNAFIAARAEEIGFAYYDPNTLLGPARAAGQIPPVPNLANPTRPFGPLFSNDGVHPGSPAHALLARALIGVINAKYQSTIDPALVPNQEP